jgi:hypothetical protein
MPIMHDNGIGQNVPFLGVSVKGGFVSVITGDGGLTSFTTTGVSSTFTAGFSSV